MATVTPPPRTLYHVTADEAAALKAEALRSLPGGQDTKGWVSTQDALSARVWQAIAGEQAGGHVGGRRASPTQRC